MTLKSAPPPLHSVALLISFTVIFVALLPSLESLDQYATVDVFTHRVFPDRLSLTGLAYIRLIFALFIFGVSIHTVFIGKGWTQETQYRPNSKLTKAKIHFTSFKTMLPFTSISWNLLGCSFAFNSYVAFLAADQQAKSTSSTVISPWLLRISLLLFETAAPCAFLVAAVIRYAIWPNILKNKGSTDGLKHPRTLLMHNANVILVLIELSLLGGLPIHFSLFPVSPLYGITYVVFLAWGMTNRWADPKKYGPQFIYFFFDTTLGTATTVALVVLLVVLMVCYVMVATVVPFVLETLGGRWGVIVHVLLVGVLASGVCRFRD